MFTYDSIYHGFINVVRKDHVSFKRIQGNVSGITFRAPWDFLLLLGVHGVKTWLRSHTDYYLVLGWFCMNIHFNVLE